MRKFFAKCIARSYAESMMRMLKSISFSFCVALFTLALLLSFAPSHAQAAIDNTQYTGSIPSTNATALGPYTLRGTLYGVQIIAPSGSTGTVAITQGGSTIFSKSAITAGTNTYFPRGQVQTSDGSVTNSTTVLDRIPLWSQVGVTITKTDLATNTWSVQVIYDR